MALDVRKANPELLDQRCVVLGALMLEALKRSHLRVSFLARRGGANRAEQRICGSHSLLVAQVQQRTQSSNLSLPDGGINVASLQLDLRGQLFLLCCELLLLLAAANSQRRGKRARSSAP